ncbi:DUF6160 family protein [Alkalimarinus alittae]|uniref:DUF6160 domain-containing protein n=1 Tax=Alkalimarinus alittae TaxID=2961619 RepID=A0ABY6N192_9ALTE|nr:DUF6160 family protein [Alkalimarinus alittae]UZE95849.1 hypothetical protein NKI27_17620 [Alkalimarinus alittae]
MKKKALLLGLSCSLLSPLISAELTKLDDEILSAVSGQSGISLDIDLKAEIGEIAYFDDGAGIAIQGIKISDASNIENPSKQSYILDIENDGSLNIAYDISPTRFEFSDIRFGTEAGSMTGASGGGFFWDYTLNGSLNIRGGGALGSSGYTFTSSYTMTDGAFGYRTQGNSFWFEDIDAVSESVMTLDVGTDVEGDYLDVRLPNYTGEYTVGAIRHSSNPLLSAGSLWGKYDLTTNILLRAGGREGLTGLTIDAQNTINRYDFAWGDDGYWVGALGVTGYYNVDNLTLDVASDISGKLGLAIAWDKAEAAYHIDKLVLGETKARIDQYLAGTALTGGPSTLKSIGSLDMQFVFADQVVDGVNYSNIFHVQAGGNVDAGEQGLRISSQWSLVDQYESATNVSNVTYTDDGNSIMLSGLQSWGEGDITLNVTEAGIINGTEFFDGIRVGFEDFKGGYKIDGLRVGKNDAQLKNQDIQGGTELLLALGVYPSYDFTADGHITIGTGGRSGEGLTINSDIHITNGRAALMADENGRGIWATGLDYDIHKRNMTIDVTEDGLAIVEGESWSVMDISGLRLGDKITGQSFGRFVVKRYETGSSMIIKAGGAGDICVGGNATDAVGCGAAGGIWEERGSEGITLSLKNILAEAVSETKRNSFTWESTGGSVANRPMQIVFDNITTNDGDGITNTYGIQNDISIDVYQTKVVKKITGADSKGVVGNKGDEKILDGSAAGYRYVSKADMSATPSLESERPLGFAVNANTRFKELSFGSVQMVHPDAAQPSTLVYGMSLQNASITSNLTATPIQ